MKKFVIFLGGTLFFLSNLQAQTENKNIRNDYNKWSIELDGGVNKPQSPFSANAYTTNISPFVGDLGVRYMFNNKFGLKADFGYNSFIDDGKGSDKFDSKYYRANLQAVTNLGRIMNFESWTNTIGLLGHVGAGVAQLESKEFHVKDRMTNLIAGFTGQIRLSNRIALTGDFTTILNASQDFTIDGASKNSGERGFTGVLFNGTVGLNVYLGKNTKHADWTVISDASDLSELENKLAELQNKLNNPPAKEVIIEKQITNTPVVSDKDIVKEMINDKYYSVYFDFNKSTPIENSTAAIDAVLTYLRKNPSASLDIIGYADQVGSFEYNGKLSNARAENVKKILTQAGISSSRLNVVPAGADTSIQKDSDEARRLARRVTFKVK